MRVRIGAEHRDLAMDAAFQVGALAAVEHPEGFEVSFSMTDVLLEQLNRLQLELLSLDAQTVIQLESVPWENWNANWESFFKPLQIGKRLLVLPEWAPIPADKRIPIRIRPALAFGTGTHETTRLCLEYLEQTVRPGMHVLDLGTGSGILGIAALKLGASHVDGIDNDPFVGENVDDNLRINACAHAFRLHLEDRIKLTPPYDLLVANILRKNLFPVLPAYYDKLKPGATIILSGLLREEDHLLRHLLESCPWKILHARTKNEWIAYQCIAESS